MAPFWGYYSLITWTGCYTSPSLINLRFRFDLEFIMLSFLVLSFDPTPLDFWLFYALIAPKWLVLQRFEPIRLFWPEALEPLPPIVDINALLLVFESDGRFFVLIVFLLFLYAVAIESGLGIF